MSKYSTPFCSDEELLEELGKLGYNEVSKDVFNMMKDDLSELVEKDQKKTLKSDYDISSSPKSSKHLTSSDEAIEYRTTKESSKKSDSSVSRKVKKKSHRSSSKISSEFETDNLVSETSKPKNTRKGRKAKSSNVSVELENFRNDEALSDLDVSENKYTSANGLKSMDNYSSVRTLKSDINRNEDIEYDYSAKSYSSKGSDYQLNYSSNPDGLSLKSDISSSKFRNNAAKDSKFASTYGKSYDQAYGLSDIRKTDNLQKNVKDAFKTFKLEKNYSGADEPLVYNYKGSDLNLNTSQSSSSEKKTIKRKVLRRRNGRSVITEELVEIPSVFDTSYPDTESFNNSKSFSSDDLSYKSNGSTGSIIAVSPEISIKSSPSTFSLLSTRSTSLRVPNSRKKKSDPVAMYRYYRKYWDNFKPPGENTHDRLRWAVRDKMLDYNI